MGRILLRTLLAAGVYGFSAGSAHSLGQAMRNLLKFPLLILVTGAVCAPAWGLLARFVASNFSFRDAQAAALHTFHDLAVMLASFAPVCLFLGLTLERPESVDQLGEYPMFLLLNVGLIGLAGTVALLHHGRRLARCRGLGKARAGVLLALWLAMSLVTGGQCAWFLRPYYNWSFQTDAPFIFGATSSYRGATNFFEEVWFHLTG